MKDFRQTCPHCGQHFRCEPRLAGRTVICPRCGGRLVLTPPTETPSLHPDRPAPAPMDAPEDDSGYHLS